MTEIDTSLDPPRVHGSRLQFQISGTGAMNFAPGEMLGNKPTLQLAPRAGNRQRTSCDCRNEVGGDGGDGLDPSIQLAAAACVG